MEDHFDKLFYLVVGVVYLFFNKSKNSNADERTVIDKPFKHQPSSTTSKNWANTWEDEASKAPVVKKSLPQTAIRKVPPRPMHKTTAHSATQQPHSKKTDRKLRRYGSWQKAIIMGEVIQPYS
jgi:hypothetical protein